MGMIPEGTGYTVSEDSEGRKVVSCEEPLIGSKFTGFWYPLSDMYVADDPSYNEQMIKMIDEKLTKHVNHFGMMSMKYVLDVFGVPNNKKYRKLSDTYLGWTDSTWRGIDIKSITFGEDPLTGRIREEYQVIWATPQTIYMNEDYDLETR